MKIYCEYCDCEYEEGNARQHRAGRKHRENRQMRMKQQNQSNNRRNVHSNNHHNNNNTTQDDDRYSFENPRYGGQPGLRPEFNANTNINRNINRNNYFNNNNSSSNNNNNTSDSFDPKEGNNTDLPSTPAEWLASINRFCHCKLCGVRINAAKYPDAAAVHIKGLKHTKKMRLINWKQEKTRFEADKGGISIIWKGATTETATQLIAVDLQLNNEMKDGASYVDIIFLISNSSSTTKILNKISFVPELKLQYQQNYHFPFTITASTTKQFLLRFHATNQDIGVYNLFLLFGFSGFLITRNIQITIGDRTSLDSIRLLAPISVFDQENYNKPKKIDIQSQIIPGEKPEFMLQKYVRNLDKFDIPKEKTLLFKQKNKEIISTLFNGDLTMNNYCNRMRDLLYLEENQMKIDITHYDTVDEFQFEPKGPYLRLKVIGLAENRPSVVKGDYILVSETAFENSKITYQGYVHVVELEHIQLKFHRDFIHRNWIRGRKYHIRFTFNRIPLRRAHSSIEHVKNQFQLYQQVLFPSILKAILKKTTVVTKGDILRLNENNHNNNNNNNNHNHNNNTNSRNRIAEVLHLDSSDPLLEEYWYLKDLKLVITDDIHECSDWIIENDLLDGSIHYIAIDMEGSGQGTPLALIQICTPTACLLYSGYSSKGSYGCSNVLQMLLSYDEVQKFVFDSSGDTTSINNLLGITPEGLIDVQAHAKSLLRLRQKPSLKMLAAELLNITMTKDPAITRSNWSQYPLSKKQILYAAADAFVTFLLAKKLSLVEEDEAPVIPKRLTRMDYIHNNNNTGSNSREMKSDESSVDLSWRNRTLNEQQKLAVTNIYLSNHKPYPYIVIGPPGKIIHKYTYKYISNNLCFTRVINNSKLIKIILLTLYIVFFIIGTGKTSTLIEAIKQVYSLSQKEKRKIRILCVAPSNFAADLILERLHPDIRPPEVFRLNAPSRSVFNLKHEIITASKINSKADQFLVPSLEEIIKYNVIVSTVMSSGLLYAMGIQPNHFTHIFVDEAGQATEPELLVSLAGIYNSNTALILAGDPQQLGPIIRSPIAKEEGLQMSLLERLVQHNYQHKYKSNKNNQNEEKKQSNITTYNSPYSIISNSTDIKSQHQPCNPQYITHLIHNYRSHSAILSVPNELFYNNRLIASADQFRNLFCQCTDIFPTKNFPVLFHSIIGKEERESKSPSWFNSMEAAEVLKYVKKCLDYKSAGLSLSDIGIITPYRKQVEKINTLLKSKGIDLKKLRVGSVEEFQGQERRVIIISTVRSEVKNLAEVDEKFQLGFVKQEKRMNVALTRAQAALIVIGNASVLVTDNNWKRFINYCQENKSFIGSDPKPPTNPTPPGGSSSSSNNNNNNNTSSQDKNIWTILQGLETEAVNNHDDSGHSSDDEGYVRVSVGTAEEASWRTED